MPTNPNTGMLLQQLIPHILLRWEEHVRQEVPAASGLPEPVLRDHLPNFLAALVATLKGEIASPCDADEVYHIHAQQREHLRGYTVDQVLREYQLLRKIIIQELEREQPLLPEARESLWDAFDQARQEAAEEFVQAQSARHEETHQQAETRRHTLLQVALDAIITINQDDRVIEWNPAAEQLFGYRQDEALQRRVSDLIVPPSWREAHLQGMLRFLATGEAPVVGKRLELLAVRQDGTELQVELTVTRIHTDGPPLFTAFVRDITEQKRAERLLVRQLEFTQRLTSSLGEAVYALDQVGKLTFLNPAGERILGWSQEELQGRLMHETIHYCRPDGSAYPVEECPLLEVFRSQAVIVDHEDVFLRKDGTLFPVLCSSAPLLHEGELVGAVVAFQDITRTKQAEQEREQLLERERQARAEAEAGRLRLLKLFQQAPAGIVVTRGPDHIIDFANEPFLALFCDRDCLGQPLERVLPDLKAQGLLALRDRVYRTGEPFVGREFPVRWARGGEPRQAYFNVVYQPILDPAGAVEGIFTHSVDVTDQVVARRRIEALAAEHETILRELADGIILADNEGKITFVNDAARRIHGTAELGVPVERYAETYHVLTPEGEPFPAAELPLARAVLRGETVVNAEWCIHREDGRRVVAEGSATPIRAEDGTQLGAVLLLRDVTEQRALQREREALLRELAQSNERKDQFLATLAHELRNPLAPILTAVRYLQAQGDQEPAQARARATIERQAQQLSRLIEDLLDVSRITRGLVELRKERIDLGTVVADAVQTARPVLDGREQHLSVSVPLEPVFINADPTRLEQVLTNLLTNAAKFTPPEGQVSVTAECERGQVVLRVRDSGKGIPPEMLPYVFDLFTQVNPSIDRAEGGLGLGLTLVKNLVEMHGGSVEARSEGLGQGSEFIVRLPALPRIRNVPRQPAVPAALETSVPTVGLRVLVVDDNVDAAETLADLLPLWGHEVWVAFSGPAALAAAAEFHPDVVLLDIGLPGMDGYEVARRLRMEPQVERLCLTALTGFGQEQDRQRSREAGFDHHLVKPVNLDQLQRLLAAQCHTLAAD